MQGFRLYQGGHGCRGHPLLQPDQKKDLQHIQKLIIQLDYLDFVLFYKQLFEKLKDSMVGGKNKLSNGLNKLSEANSTITNLKQKLVELQPILVQKTIQIKELIQKLTQDQLQANQVKKVVESEANEINIQSEKIAIMKAEAEQILKEAQPILQGAVEQLDKLNRGDISEIKQNNNPHALVKYTMECVAILIEEKTDWDNIKKNVLGDAGLLTKLKNLRGENITPATKEKIKKRLNGNPLFVPTEMKSINVAAKSICEWIHAVNNYTDVYREIQQKKDNCKTMDLELQEANKKLAEKQKELEIVIKKVQTLEKNYSDSKIEKEQLDNEIKQTEERLHRASQLTEGLAEEQVRWKEQVIHLVAEIDVLLGNAFLSAAYISFLGPYSGLFRNEILNQWMNYLSKQQLPVSQTYTLEKLMGNPVEIREWQQKGLSSDNISVNNGILVQESMSYPLIIDPQNQACKWIKNMESENSLIAIKLNSEHFAKSLEESVMMGKPMLIEDIDETLPSILDQILTKQYTVDQGKKMVKVGEENIHFNPNFKLFITTKLQNPVYLPEIFIKTQVVNFSVSKEGLQEKLLGDVLSFELPEDDKIRRELIVSIADDRLLLKKGEERILDLLTNSRGMILDDIELIESLKISKEIARAVSDKILVSEKKQEEINKGMVMYQGVAKRGVVLFFVISELTLIDPMYQFSLNYFSNLFQNIIANTPNSDDRINQLIEVVTKTIFEVICRGLFNKHKQIFSFMLAIQIEMQEKETISQKEFMYFVQGVNPKQPEFPYPNNSQFTEKQWAALTFIAKNIKSYEPIQFAIQKFLNLFNLYVQSPTIVTDPCPIEEITPFQKLILINIFRFEKTIFAVDQFIRQTIGEDFIFGNVAPLDVMFQELDYKTPLIFILSPGADPLMSLMRFAKEQRIPAENLFMISLGQGQGVVAEAAIQQAQKSGGWVILQNCHLGKSFMPELEKKLEQFDQPEGLFELNQEFRLILTSMPCDYFPVTILQNSMKLTCEPPKGVKNNLLKTYSNLSDEKLIIEESKSNNFYKLTFALSLFHASVLERRKYGSIGYNVYYQFNDSDLDAALASLRNLIEQFEYVPWDALHMIIGQINYGGRITDEQDRSLLAAMLLKFCNEKALLENYQFSSTGDFLQQPVGPVETYVQYINHLPDIDPTEIFGLHKNANINFQLKESNDMINTVLQLQSLDGSISNDGESLQHISVIKDLQQRIPEELVPRENLNILNSLEVFLSQEIYKFNNLLRQMRNTLKDLKSAISGETLISLEIEKMNNQIRLNKVPLIWEKQAYPNLKPLSSWFNDLIERVNFYVIQINTIGNLKSYWISAQFYPQGFITSICQNYARYVRCPIDKISLKFNFLPIMDPAQIQNPPIDACNIHGLFSEGIRFEVVQNKVSIEHQIPGQLFYQVPVVQFIPYQNQDMREEKLFQIPLYKTLVRDGITSTTGQSTNYIISFNLNLNGDKNFWILQGAALFCTLNE